MLRLGVNIDHVATLRQARYRGQHEGELAEPDPVAAALVAEAAGAHGITAHLRADRRHMQESDLRALRQKISTKLNLEMGLSPEIVEFALDLGPDDVCLVPEEREEITTEGGLDCVGRREELGDVIPLLREAGMAVSLFLDPQEEQIREAVRLGAQFVELHTGAYANAADEAAREAEWQRLQRCAGLAGDLGLRVNAGHGLNYRNVSRICGLPHLEELNIGHSIISRAVTVGLGRAVLEMLELLQKPA
jgi:pyridoxine 5-phosphate synthase